MADRRELTVGGKPISSLRVVDLKVELEKRSLPKSGSKKDLLERLRLHLQLEENREAALKDEEHVPNLSLCNETENDFIKEYLAAQQARFQVQREAKKQFEEMKRESEASAEETTQDEDEASEVSPSKKSPRKAIRPRKKEDTTSASMTHRSSLEFQTPESIPYSTPPQEKHEEDSASQEDDMTGEDEELKNVATPQARKHKLLKYVEPRGYTEATQPNEQQSYPMEGVAAASNSGKFSISDHVEKYETEKSYRRDPPPSTLYEEAINLKVDKKDAMEVKPSVVPSKKTELGSSQQVLPRVVEVWSENKDEPDAAKEKPQRGKTTSKRISAPKDESMEVTAEIDSPIKMSVTPEEEVRIAPKKSTTPVDESKIITPVEEKAAPSLSVSTNQAKVEPMEVSETRTKVAEKDAVKETSVVTETPKELPVVEETPKEVPVVEETPKEVPVVEETPKEVPVVEETPKEVPVVEETPKEVPVVEETPKEVPVVEETPKEVPVVEETHVNVPIVEETTKEVPVIEEPHKELPVIEEAPVPETASKVAAFEGEIPDAVAGETNQSQTIDEITPGQTAAADFHKNAASKVSDEEEKPIEKEEAPLQKESSPFKVAGIQGETVSDKQVVGKAMENKVPVHSSVGDVERSTVAASVLKQSETPVATAVQVDAKDEKQNVRASTTQPEQNLPNLSSPKVGSTEQ